MSKANSPSANPASIQQVAAHAGVSIATVSRVLNGVNKKFSQATSEKVMAAVASLGYRATGAGSALRRGQSRLVAVLASNMTNPAMAAIAAGTEVALRKAGYVMVLCDTHDVPSLQDEYLREMRAQYARGLILLGAVESPQLKLELESSQRIVFVNRRAPLQTQHERFVGIDNHAAGREIVDWCQSQNFKHLALIHGDLNSSATRERVAGFSEQCDRLGFHLAKTQRETQKNMDHLNLGHAGMAKLVGTHKKLDAVFCTSDLIAYGAHRFLFENRPDLLSQIKLVGFDRSPMNDWIAPWLNSVRVPYDTFGDAIVTALESEEGCHLLLPHQWVPAGNLA